jgi:hypothetical protein
MGLWSRHFEKKPMDVGMGGTLEVEIYRAFFATWGRDWWTECVGGYFLPWRAVEAEEQTFSLAIYFQKNLVARLLGRFRLYLV